MEGVALPIREIVGITEELARYWQDHHLMDQLTVTRGYAELAQIDPANLAYYGKLHLALQRLSEMADQRGLRSVTERIRNMGVVVAPRSQTHHSTSAA
jgi:hypothetical protein